MNSSMLFSLFKNHFSFYLGYLGMSYINVFGFILFAIFVLQFFSGILLSCYYSSFAGFSAVYYIMIDVNVGWLVRFVHVIGASIFMLFILFHFLRAIWIRLRLIEQIEYLTFSSLFIPLSFNCFIFFFTPSVFMFLINCTPQLIFGFINSFSFSWRYYNINSVCYIYYFLLPLCLGLVNLSYLCYAFIYLIAFNLLYLFYLILYYYLIALFGFILFILFSFNLLYLFNCSFLFMALNYCTCIILFFLFNSFFFFLYCTCFNLWFYYIYFILFIINLLYLILLFFFFLVPFNLLLYLFIFFSFLCTCMFIRLSTINSVLFINLVLFSSLLIAIKNVFIYFILFATFILVLLILFSLPFIKTVLFFGIIIFISFFFLGSYAINSVFWLINIFVFLPYLRLFNIKYLIFSWVLFSSFNLFNWAPLFKPFHLFSFVSFLCSLPLCVFGAIYINLVLFNFATIIFVPWLASLLSSLLSARYSIFSSLFDPSFYFALFICFYLFMLSFGYRLVFEWFYFIYVKLWLSISVLFSSFYLVLFNSLATLILRHTYFNSLATLILRHILFNCFNSISFIVPFNFVPFNCFYFLFDPPQFILFSYYSLYSSLFDPNRFFWYYYIYSLRYTLSNIILIYSAINNFWFYYIFYFAHLIKPLYSSLYSSPFSFIWISGLLLLFSSLLVSFLGYCLCFGQMSYWGITVIINVFSIIPFFGFYIGSYLWCSSLVVLGRVFIFHFAFGFILFLLVLVHLVLLHLVSSFNLVNNNYSTIIPFYSLFYKDCFVMNFVGILFCFCLYLEPDIFGSCDNLVFANPLSTPSHIVPEWYFLVFYCILRAFPNKTIGVIVVIIFISFFLGE